MLVEDDGNSLYNRAMHFLRLFLVLVLSVTLPFSNVAAAEMVHCSQTAPASAHPATDIATYVAPGARMVHADSHAGHALVHVDQEPDHAEDHSPAQDDPACGHCSYCQACVSAMAPENPAQLRVAKPVREIFFFTATVTQSVQDPLFRPPRSTLV